MNQSTINKLIFCIIFWIRRIVKFEVKKNQTIYNLERMEQRTSAGLRWACGLVGFSSGPGLCSLPHGSQKASKVAHKCCERRRRDAPAAPPGGCRRRRRRRLQPLRAHGISLPSTRGTGRITGSGGARRTVPARGRRPSSAATLSAATASSLSSPTQPPAR